MPLIDVDAILVVTALEDVSKHFAHVDLSCSLLVEDN
jgi:hypothetical protein